MTCVVIHWFSGATILLVHNGEVARDEQNKEQEEEKKKQNK